MTWRLARAPKRSAPGYDVPFCLYMTREDLMTKNDLFNAHLAADHKQTAVVGTPITDLKMQVEKSKEPTFLPYGYKLCPQSDGADHRFEGSRTIETDQASVVRRIYQLYADGMSPTKIAEVLNAEGIPGPRGGKWREAAIRGHAGRGTGILNNESYLGGSSVSASDRDLADALKIVSDELWARVKLRQGFAVRSPAGTP